MAGPSPTPQCGIKGKRKKNCKRTRELKAKLKNGYQPIIPDLYPGLWAVVRQLLVAFPSSHLVERGFSMQKARPATNSETRDLRLRLTSMQLNVDKLVSLRQNQPSH
ncbi:hypothetical protein M514_06219 [Trichuris suis]|uniref:Uncharacterized protein n=1 Tax=Trichuris suis TaxID=68888 RepID=A0A085N2N0_9BILA|nr:hypothetical protein M513_06219 [Trichuris suis]KFD63726.1 hypothetical protein M514_06219 [Trichuris suis]